MSFSERLVAPWWWWLLALGLTGGAAAELQRGAGTPLVYVVLPGLALAFLVLVSRQRVSVVDGILQVPGARAPVGAFGVAEVLTGAELRTWLGPRAQRWAHVRVRPWLATAVRLELDDPTDETPYWLVGTRQPDALLAALRR